MRDRTQQREYEREWLSRPGNYERKLDALRRSVRQAKINDIKKFKMRNMLNDAKITARAKNIEFNITYNDLGDWRNQKYCPVFPWIELRWDNVKREDNSPTIDRKDNSLGYIAGNVRIICYRANRLKSDATPLELSALYVDSTKNGRTK